MRFFIIISFFILLASSVLSEENIENSIESDEIEYFNETGELKAFGSVKITRGNFQLEADEVILIKKIISLKVVEMLLSKKKTDQLFLPQSSSYHLI